MAITEEQWGGFLKVLQSTFAETNSKISELASSIGKIEEKVGKIDIVENSQNLLIREIKEDQRNFKQKIEETLFREIAKITETMQQNFKNIKTEGFVPGSVFGDGKTEIPETQSTTGTVPQPSEPEIPEESPLPTDKERANMETPLKYTIAEAERMQLRKRLADWKNVMTNYFRQNINLFKDLHLNRVDYIKWDFDMLNLAEISRVAYLSLYLNLKKGLSVQVGKKKSDIIETESEFFEKVNPYFCTFYVENGLEIPIFFYETTQLNTRTYNSKNAIWTKFLLFICTMVNSESQQSLKNILTHAEERFIQFKALNMDTLMDKPYRFNVSKKTGLVGMEERKSKFTNQYFNIGGPLDIYAGGDSKMLRNFLMDKGDVDAIPFSAVLEDEGIPLDYSPEGYPNTMKNASEKSKLESKGLTYEEVYPKIHRTGDSVYFGSIIKQRRYNIDYPENWFEKYGTSNAKLYEFMQNSIRRALEFDYRYIVAERLQNKGVETYFVIKVRFTVEMKNKTDYLLVTVFKGYLGEFDSRFFIDVSAKKIAEANGSDVNFVNPVLDPTFFEVNQVDLVFSGGNKQIENLNNLSKWIAENRSDVMGKEKIYSKIPGFKLVDYPSKDNGCFSKILMEHLKALTKNNIMTKEEVNKITDGKTSYTVLQNKYFIKNEKVDIETAKSVCESIGIPLRVFDSTGTVILESDVNSTNIERRLDIMIAESHFLHVRNYNETIFKESLNAGGYEEDGELNIKFTNKALIFYDLETISDEKAETIPYAIGYQMHYPEIENLDITNITEPKYFMTSSPSNNSCFSDLMDKILSVLESQKYQAFVEREVAKFNKYNREHKVLKSTKRVIPKNEAIKFEMKDKRNEVWKEITGQYVKDTNTYHINFVMIAYNGAAFDHNLLFRYCVDKQYTFSRPPNASGRLNSMRIGLKPVVTKNGFVIVPNITVWDPMQFIGGAMSLNKIAENYNLPITKEDLDHDSIQKVYEAGVDNFNVMFKNDEFQKQLTTYLIRDVELVRDVTLKMLESEFSLYNNFVQDILSKNDLTFYTEQNRNFYINTEKSVRGFCNIHPGKLAGDARTTIFDYVSLSSYAYFQLKMTRGWSRNKPKSIEYPIIDRQIRKQIIGGRVEGEVGSFTATDMNHLYHMVDVVSLYPYVMSNASCFYPVSATPQNDPKNEFVERDENGPILYDDGYHNQYYVSYSEYAKDPEYHQKRIKTVLDYEPFVSQRVAMIHAKIDQSPLQAKGLQHPILPTRMGDRWNWKIFGTYQGLIPCVTLRQCIKYGCKVEILYDVKDSLDQEGTPIPLYIMFPASNQIFTDYIGFWSKVKNEQDEFKRIGSPKYNPVQRSMAKDRLNAIFGKMIQRIFNNDDELFIRSCGSTAIQDFIRKFTEMQTEFERVESEIEKEYKVRLNSYTAGMEKAKNVFTENGIPESIKKLLEKTRPTFTTIGENGLYLMGYKEKTPKTPAQVGVFILAYAKAYMYDTFFSKMKVYYSDTDSAIIDSAGFELLQNNKLIVGPGVVKKFGKLEHESMVSSFTVSMPKCYFIMGVDKKGNFDPKTSKGRCKGIPLGDDLNDFDYFENDEDKALNVTLNDAYKESAENLLKLGSSPDFVNSVMITTTLINGGWVRTYTNRTRNNRREGKLMSKFGMPIWLHNDSLDAED